MQRRALTCLPLLLAALAACGPTQLAAPPRPAVQDLTVARAPSTLPPEIIEVRPDQTVYTLSTTADGGARVTTRWTEPGGAGRALDFVLPGAALDPRAHALALPTGEQLTDSAIAAAIQAANSPAPGMSVRVRRQGATVAVNAYGGGAAERQAEVDRIMAAYAGGFDSGVAAAGFRRTGQAGAAHVLQPDHAAIARTEVGLLAPAAQAVAAATPGLSARARIDWLLGFLQSIPYEAPRSGDTPLRLPAGVFASNRGDCESKSLAMAALVAALEPGMTIVMLRRPDHAFLALGLPPMPGDTVVTVGGRELVAAEPVGPGRYEIGHVSPLARALLLDPSHEVILLTGAPGG